MVTLIHNNYSVFWKKYSVTKLPCNISVFPIENFWQYLICLCLVSIVLKCGCKSFYHVNLRNAGARVFTMWISEMRAQEFLTLWISEMRVQEFLPCKSQKCRRKSFYHVNLRNAGARVFTMWISEMRVQELLPCESQKCGCKSFYHVNLRNAGARVFTM